MRLPRLPRAIVLRPARRAVVPEARRVTLGALWGKFKRLILVVTVAVMFVLLQLAAGWQSVQPTVDLNVAIIILGILALVVLLGSDLRWRLLMVVSVLVIISGQVGYYFGQSFVYSTFNAEWVASAALILLVLFDHITQRRESYPAKDVLLAFSTLAVVVILSLMLTDREVAGRDIRVLSTQFILGVALIAGAYLYFDNWSKMRTYLKLMMGVAFVFASLGVVEYFRPYQYYAIYQTLFPGVENASYVRYALQTHRIFGMFTSGPGLAVWLMMFTPLVMYTILFNSNHLKKLIGVVVLCIILTAVFFTGARGPFVCGVMAMVLLSWLSGDLRRAVATTLGFALAAAMLVSFATYLSDLLPGQTVIARLNVPAEEQLSTLQEREKVWREGVETWRQHKWLGIGLGEWSQERQQSVTIWLKRGLRSSHSAYVELMVETGILGLLAAAWVILATLQAGWDAVKASPPGSRRGMAAAIYSTAVYLFVTGIAEPAFVMHRNFYFLCLGLGLLLKIPVVARQEVAEPVAETVRGASISQVPVPVK